MPEDINELDVTDAGLKAVMGNRFHDETENAQSKPDTAQNAHEHTKPVAVHTPTHDFKDGKWELVKPEPNWMDKLKNAVMWGFGFGCLSCLVFYWKEAGLMAESIAVPVIAVCTAFAGFGIGKNARCK